jgi:guanylate kinase
LKTSPFVQIILALSIEAVESVQTDGKICVLDIDVQGVRKVKESSLSPRYLFISPPSTDDLEKRLRGRGTETEESIKKRLGNAAKEMAYGQEAGNFDRIFVNADLNETFEVMATAFRGWYPHLNEVAPDDKDPKNCTCAIS